MSNIFSSISNIANGITSLPQTLIDGVVNGIKEIFIPDTAEIEDSINHLKESLLNKFGVDAIDLTGIMGTETEIENQTGTIDVYGLGSFETTVLDVGYIKTAVNTFRPYIRGLLTLFLLFYNFNQFVQLIGSSKISEAGGHLKDGENK